MGLGAILGGVLGLGKVFGGLIKKRRQKRNQPDPAPIQRTSDPVNLSAPGKTVATGGNPFAPQPFVAAQPQQANVAPSTPGAVSPLDKQKNQFLLRFILKNSSGDLFNGR